MWWGNGGVFGQVLGTVWELRGNNFFFRGNNLGITWGNVGGKWGFIKTIQTTIPINQNQMLIFSQNVKNNYQNNLSNQKHFVDLYQ